MASRLSFSELFDDISLMLNVRRICVVVDSLISAAKLCDCVIPAGVDGYCDIDDLFNCGFAKIVCAKH